MSRRDQNAESCEAYYLRGGKCPHAVKHTHRDVFGDTWRLCGIHMRTITRREKHGTPGELVTGWRERGAKP